MDLSVSLTELSIDEWRDLEHLSMINTARQVHIVETSKTVIGDEERTSSGTQAIGRAVSLLRLLASKPRTGVTLSELVDGSGLLKPTCRRILLALIEAGLAMQDDETRRYFLGPEAYVLGTVASERHGIHRLALEGVSRLARETGDAAFLQMRSGWSVVCLHREDGDYPLRSHVLAAGDRHPLGAGAGGLALLAALPDDDVEAAIAANGKLCRDRYPMLTPEMIHRIVRETRDRGYSMNRGLLFPGSWGMGMVVRDRQGRPDACLSLAAVESRMQPDRQPQLAQWLATEVDTLERRANGGPSTGRDGLGPAGTEGAAASVSRNNTTEEIIA
jgi:DNA-binding IclR family transcriptional regulator